MFQDEDRETGILGVPLSPEVLRRIGALKNVPPLPDGFRPDGDWTLSYRIFGCHGYVDQSNETVGVLRIRRAAGDPFRLQVHQDIRHNNGGETLDIEMTCRPNPIASPLSWTLTGKRFDEDGKELPELATTQKQTNRPASLTSDFSLFEAVQRLPFNNAAPIAFDLMEGMNLRRTGHRLYYGGERRFHHIGQGMLPYQYWLDEHHRLLLAVMQWRAYILDPAAENPVAPRLTKKGKKRSGR
jgi:hypothetical protein